MSALNASSVENQLLSAIIKEKMGNKLVTFTESQLINYQVSTFIQVLLVYLLVSGNGFFRIVLSSLEKKF